MPCRTRWRSFPRTGITALFFLAAVFAFVLAVPEAHAQQAALSDLGATSGLPTTSLPILIARIIRAVLGVLGILLTVLIIYGGYLYMTAAGSAERVQKAKTVLKNAIIGALITVSAFAITQFVLGVLLGRGAGGPGIVSQAPQFFDPLSGALGSGIIQDHYPPRNALDVARNTKVFLTFKEPVLPASVIQGYDAGLAFNDSGQSRALNADTVRIFITADGAAAALASDQVVVQMDEAGRTFVFDPVPFLGDGLQDVNYTVSLTSNLQRADGSAAFAGASADGYQWTFEVGTEIDLTPPQVVSVIPVADGTFDKNISVQITFDEAMDPVAGTGTFDPADGLSPEFTNIRVTDGTTTVVGTYAISNGYRTIEFTPAQACGVDPCGGTIFCLPGNAGIGVTALAAELGDEPPQALQIGVSYNGLVDAAGNSLDGNADGDAQGPDADNFAWNFGTTDNVNDEVPRIVRIAPGINEGDVDPDRPLEFVFSTPMKSSTLVSTHIQLWPDPYYPFWFLPRSTDLSSLSPETPAGLDVAAVGTRVAVGHPTLISLEAGGWDYYPVVTNGVRSAYQICMHPAFGPEAETQTGQCAVTASAPYCCNGVASANRCSAGSGVELPDTSE